MYSGTDFCHDLTKFEGKGKVSCPWIVWWRHKSFRFYKNSLKVTYFKKCLIHVLFIASIFRWEQFTKHTRTSGCSADPMGSEMFPRSLTSWKNANFPRESFQDIYFIIQMITYKKMEGEGQVSWILLVWK